MSSTSYDDPFMSQLSLRGLCLPTDAAPPHPPDSLTIMRAPSDVSDIDPPVAAAPPLVNFSNSSTNNCTTREPARQLLRPCSSPLRPREESTIRHQSRGRRVVARIFPSTSSGARLPLASSNGGSKSLQTLRHRALTHRAEHPSRGQAWIGGASGLLSPPPSRVAAMEVSDQRALTTKQIKTHPINFEYLTLLFTLVFIVYISIVFVTVDIVVTLRLRHRHHRYHLQRHRHGGRTEH